MQKIFVDTWAWYALTDRNDTDHDIAEAANLKLIDGGYTFVTTNFVLAESVTLIRYKMYHDASVRFWETMKQMNEAELLDIIRVTKKHEEDAWAIFEHYADQDFSFTDCTSFAVMQEQQVSQVFTADHHFSVMGFIRVP
jgi:uncharacterized protein